MPILKSPMAVQTLREKARRPSAQNDRRESGSLPTAI
jgi:hypothetical protein